MTARRWFSAMSLMLLTLLATACQVGPEAPSRPVKPPVTLLYQDALPPGVTDTAAYREAVAQGMVLCGDRPATDGALVRWFLEEAEAGREAQLLIAVFSSPQASGREEGSVTIDRFQRREDGVYLSSAHLATWSDTEISFGPQEQRIVGLSLNDYGYLVYDIPGLYGPYGVQVLHPRELYLNHDEAEEILAAYLRPIANTALGHTSWEDPGELHAWLELYEEISDYLGQNAFDLYGNDWPVDAVLATLNQYFDHLTREDLALSQDNYNAAADTILRRGWRNAELKPLRVLDWTEQGELLVIRYESYDRMTGTPAVDEYLLTVRRLPDGSFHYLSNTYAPYINRLARDAFLDPQQLRPHQNNAYLSDHRPEGPRLELVYGQRHVLADPTPLLERGVTIYSQNGAFVTGPKTAIAFGGSSEETRGLPVAVLISEDMGGTWDVAELPDSADPHILWGQKRIGFTTLDTGWLLMPGMDESGKEHRRLYTTADGGKSWVRRTLPSRDGWAECSFVSPTVGFFSYVVEDGSGQPLWRTTDGGQSWVRLTLPVPDGTPPQETCIYGNIQYTRGRIEVPVTLTVNGAPSERTYTSWDWGESWSAPVRMPSFNNYEYSGVTVTMGGSTQVIQHPYEAQSIKWALAHLTSQDCLAAGTDPQGLLPGYERLEQVEYHLAGPQAEWTLRLSLGETTGLVWQSGDPARYYLMKQSQLEELMQQCRAAKTEAVEREQATSIEDYTNPELRQRALAMGYPEEYLDFLQTSGRYVGDLLSKGTQEVDELLVQFAETQAFLDRLLGMGWDQLAAAAAESPVFSPDGDKGVFFCYNHDEYYSPSYLIWCDRRTGQTKYLGTTDSTVRALDRARSLLVVSRYSSLLTFDIESGEAVPEVYAFDFGSRLASGDPQRVVRGLGYDGFADRFVVIYTQNPYGDWLHQEPMLAVFEGGGRHLRDVHTGRVIISSHKNFPILASFVSFTDDGRIRSDLGLEEPLDMVY